MYTIPFIRCDRSAAKLKRGGARCAGVDRCAAEFELKALLGALLFFISQTSPAPVYDS